MDSVWAQMLFSSNPCGDLRIALDGLHLPEFSYPTGMTVSERRTAVSGGTEICSCHRVRGFQSWVMRLLNGDVLVMPPQRRWSSKRRVNVFQGLKRGNVAGSKPKQGDSVDRGHMKERDQYNSRAET